MSGQERAEAVRRFSRQIVLKEVGPAGLRAWLSSSVRVEGDGAPAQLAARYLSGAGVRVVADGTAHRTLQLQGSGLTAALDGVGQAGAALLSLLPGGSETTFDTPDAAVGPVGDPLVAIVGAGGLGCPAAIGLALAGVRRIRLIDDDVVDISNLPRQVLHRQVDVGRAKVDSGAEGLRRWAPDVEVDSRRVRLEAGNAEALLGDADLVIEGSDNFPTKFRVNAAATLVGVPVVNGGVLRMEGQALARLPGASGACYRCLFPESPAPGAAPTCSSAGILGPVAGVLGLWQAVLGLRLLAAARGEGDDPGGKLHTFDARSGQWMSFGVRRVEDCVACGPDPDDPSMRGAAEGDGPMCAG